MGTLLHIPSLFLPLLTKYCGLSSVHMLGVYLIHRPECPGSWSIILSSLPVMGTLRCLQFHTTTRDTAVNILVHVPPEPGYRRIPWSYAPRNGIYLRSSRLQNAGPAGPEC